MGRVNEEHVGVDSALVSEATAVDDEMFAVLADRYRRFTLYALLQFEQLSLEELADVVAGWTHSADWHAVTADEREKVWLVLHHTHVPKLEAAGYVTYDRDRDELSLETVPAALYDLVVYARRHEGENRFGDAESSGKTGGDRGSDAQSGTNDGDTETDKSAGADESGPDGTNAGEES
ncbi:hypothetical protein AUR64_16680 [Haloprofundus marisrubri]|uniref:DUF7344 domain-containing protein n=1 Tax=Haloprofundus marisrubri TaxID=1514971 RepID=A0A0W1R8T7_9EURY|nr:hypothetical protein [Haloprofundus marisrubri]KTG09412.1 hypothetical protein AUR64_16680 [Haloprofundus marisrubri]